MLKTLENSLIVLEKFTRENSSWGVRELARETGLNHSLVNRILKTYEAHGFLKKNKENKYELGIKLLEFGLISMDLYPINEQVKSTMKTLSEKVGESIFLTWIDGLDGLCLDFAETQNSIKFSVDKGSRTPIYAGASNKVLLAFQDDEYIDQVIKRGLKQITEFTTTDPIKLKESLAEIREQGYAYTVGEFNREVTGIAIPLFNSSNKVIASLTAAGPTYRISEEKVPYILKELVKARQEIQPIIEHYDME